MLERNLKPAPSVVMKTLIDPCEVYSVTTCTHAYFSRYFGSRACSIVIMSKKGFSLADVARSARPLTSSAVAVAQPQVKAPKVNSLVETGPRPPKRRKREATAECVVAIYPYTQDATTVWDGCKESGYTLWQVQVEHNATNSLTIGFYETFTKFLQQEEDAPDSIHELSEMAKIKLVLADSADPDGVAFVRWRASFYVAGKDNEALHNLLYLLDAFFVWANQDRDPKVTARSVACW